MNAMEQEVVKNKKKTKKTKKSSESLTKGFSMKSSFNKFDAMQKKGESNAKEQSSSMECHICSKPVYKMEEVKAVQRIFHKNCFRCQECGKLLSVDNYQSNDRVIFCAVHFKQLFGPRAVEATEPEVIRKPELIIRENQPVELPPDVVRASDKPDLGLAELQQLNVHSRFKFFEQSKQRDAEDKLKTIEDDKLTVKSQKSGKMLSNCKKFEAAVKRNIMGSNNITNEDYRDDDDKIDGDNNNGFDDDDDDLVLVNLSAREQAIGLGGAMQDIREKFEKGHLQLKEERREERKLEIQNIRSRLFTGKQARIKEMYQQAVAESDQAITSLGKVENIERSADARDIKDRFEKGAFKNGNHEKENSTSIQQDADVFNSAISKKSRSIFKDIDANVAAQHQRVQQDFTTFNHNKASNYKEKLDCVKKELDDEQNTTIIKSDQKLDDVKIETAEISSKFKFFEAYQPLACEKKTFRITPPREGVVKMPSPELEIDSKEQDEIDGEKENMVLLEKSQTMALILNKFREIEQTHNRNTNDNGQLGPRPLKRFTPPPDNGRRIYASESESSSLEDSSQEDDLDDETETDEEKKPFLNDDALKDAQAAARAKSLRAKFERWEANEIAREISDNQLNVFSKEISDETNIESTKTIRAKFENMQNVEPLHTQPRHEVKRFI